MVIYGYCIFETSLMTKIFCDIPIHIHSVCVCVCVCVCVYEIPSLLSLIPSLLLLYSISCSLPLSFTHIDLQGYVGIIY